MFAPDYRLRHIQGLLCVQFSAPGVEPRFSFVDPSSYLNGRPLADPFESPPLPTCLTLTTQRGESLRLVHVEVQTPTRLIMVDDEKRRNTLITSYAWAISVVQSGLFEIDGLARYTPTRDWIVWECAQKLPQPAASAFIRGTQCTFEDPFAGVRHPKEPALSLSPSLPDPNPAEALPRLEIPECMSLPCTFRPGLGASASLSERVAWYFPVTFVVLVSAAGFFGDTKPKAAPIATPDPKDAEIVRLARLACTPSWRASFGLVPLCAKGGVLYLGRRNEPEGMTLQELAASVKRHTNFRNEHNYGESSVEVMVCTQEEWIAASRLCAQQERSL